MEVARVINNNKRYILDYDIQECVLNVEKEYKTIKKDIRCMGFCPECYKKSILKKELIGRFKMSNISKEININKIKELASEIEQIGYEKADKSKLIFIQSDNLKKAYSDERVNLDKETREELKEFIFKERECGLRYDEVSKGVENYFGMILNDNLMSRMYKEACEEKGLKPLRGKNSRREVCIC